MTQVVYPLHSQSHTEGVVPFDERMRSISGKEKNDHKKTGSWSDPTAPHPQRHRAEGDFQPLFPSAHSARL